jgi:hypothetical protein
MIFPINRQKVTSTERYNLNVMLYQFGLFISVGLLTMVTVNLFVSGDSITPRHEHTMRLSTPPSKVVR